KFQLARPWRRAILFRPNLNQQQLVAEIRQILQGALDSFVVEKIRDHDHQAALRIGSNEFPDHRDEIGLPARLNRLQSVGDSEETMPASRRDNTLRQTLAESANLNAVEPHQPDITERRGQLARIFKLLPAMRGH